MSKIKNILETAAIYSGVGILGVLIVVGVVALIWGFGTALLVGGVWVVNALFGPFDIIVQNWGWVWLICFGVTAVTGILKR